MNAKHFSICAAALFLTLACSGPQERAVSQLARRIAPAYAERIVFGHRPDTSDAYIITTRGKKVHIEGSNANAMAAGLGKYLRDCCNADISWEKVHKIMLPDSMPLPDKDIRGRALVPQRFFLNYCTFGYTMPWWNWEDWERFIDWMALHGVNLPLAITGQEAIWQKVWRDFGLDDDQIRSWFTGPAHLPWHRMCNIDGVDGPLPQGWIDGQKRLQKKILKRERELGMCPVLPAFGGHVPRQLKELFPDSQIYDIKGWAGFPRENLPCFLSPSDSLYARIQQAFIITQQAEYGTDHIYGFDLFNEVDPPSWDPETLAAISRDAYGSISAVDSMAQWLQMGWMFYYDRKHWTPEIIRAYLDAVPAGKVTILDYYTENVPVWTLTDSFYGQPWIFCYLGNFGGNTRFAGPFRKESGRISEAFEAAKPSGIGCTLEGFGLNRWLYEYVLERAWDNCKPDDEWLAGLNKRRSSPPGFWQEMADSIYLRGSFSEGALLCGRPCLEGSYAWQVIHKTAYGNLLLVKAWRRLLDSPSDSDAWRYDAVAIGTQALSNHFSVLRDSLVNAFYQHDSTSVEEFSRQIKEIASDIAGLLACEPSFRLENWLDGAASWAEDPQEEHYYLHNAWHIITTWGVTPHLNDYASRLWSGLVSEYYAPRWNIFLEELSACLKEGRDLDMNEIDRKVASFEQEAVDRAPRVKEPRAAADVPAMCNGLYNKWFL